MATSTISSVLKDVVAYVDVWSSDKTANYSDPFIQQLQDMGAEVTKTFNKRVTHVVFNYGHPATWKKAKKGNVRLVSVLWVGRCHDEATKVDEDLFPALNDPFPNKKHRCMQPKDSPEKTPDTDKRMRKKLDKMMKDLTPQKPLVKDFSPMIIDEENGIIYSPGLKRSEYMAQRLKDMKEKRENISPTASQLVESPSELKPSLGNSPTVFKFPYDQSDDDSSPSVAETGLSPAKEEGTLLPDVKGRCYEHLIKDGTEKSFSEAFEKRLSTPVKCTIFEGNEDIEENKQSTSRTASRRTSVKRNSTDSNIPIPLSETTEPVVSASKNISKKDRRSSAVKSLKLISSRKNDSEDGKETTKEEKSETKTQRNVKSAVAAADDVSVKTTSPILEKEQPLSEQVPILSAQATTLPNDSHKTVLCPTDDDAFEDYFSPVNLQQKPKMPLTSGLVGKTFQLPFELNSDAKKTKPRRKSAVSEMTKGSKKTKLEKSAINLKDLDTGNPPERHLAKDNKMLLSDPCNSCYTALELHKVSVSSQSSVQSSSSTSRGNEDSDGSGFLETVSEEQSKEASGLLKMVHKTKVGRTLVMTSMPTEKQNTVCQVVKALGGFTVVDEVCESTTHVVSGGHRRTLNILLGIARGCWILSFEWILWSLEKRQWIPEEPYELSEQFPAAQICRLQRHLSAGEHQQDLFRDQPIMFVSQQSQPPTQSLIELIQLCGGRVCRTVRQAGLCIGKYSGRRPEGTRALSEQWVLDSIMHLKQLPYDDYTLD